MNKVNSLLEGIAFGDRRSLARAITMVENELEGYNLLLSALPTTAPTPVTGITGPPGAGKSSLISAILKELCTRTNTAGNPLQIAVLAVDPTSPFSHGSFLGDRLRMHEHFNNPQIYIRSLATRGALGGLSAKIVEIVDVLRAAPFDYIFIETVGVGQSEVEIVSLADTTLVVLVPEAGDEIQAIKSGIMEIADIFVVNKSDREGADRFAAGLIKTLHERAHNEQWNVPVVKTAATRNEGIDELIATIFRHHQKVPPAANTRLIAERAYRLIQQEKMRSVSFQELEKDIATEMTKRDFNLYAFVKKYF